MSVHLQRTLPAFSKVNIPKVVIIRTLSVNQLYVWGIKLIHIMGTTT